MLIKDFIAEYSNHPVLFVGTGISLRYLQTSYTWDGLLKKIAFELRDTEEYYLDLKSKCAVAGDYDFSKIASLLEQDLNEGLISDRNGKFKEINDTFYEGMRNGVNLSRLKIYISDILSYLDKKEEMLGEL
ncbi:MAG: hypothetical protein AAFX40_17065, partial [Cyanobacteria bacterium J06639_1]